MESATAWVLWFVAAMAGVLLLLTFVPQLVLFVPRALGYL
jgi:TRAP-type C4-dicarboxylate transport system permease large subunit